MQGNRTPNDQAVLNYSTYLHLTSDKKALQLLKDEDLKDVDSFIEVSDTGSFNKNYQEQYTSIPNSRSYSLRSLLTEALSHSNAEFKQYDLKQNRIKELVNSIFKKDHWLMNDIVVGDFNGKLYLIGGRHRIFSIAHVFALLAQAKFNDEEQRQSLFIEYLEQSIRVIYKEIKDKNYLLPLLIKDNDSRRMRGAEIAHLDAQTLGANSEGIDSISSAALNADNHDKTIRIAALHFARRSHRNTTKETRLAYGKYIARWAIFGIRPGQRLKDNIPHKVKEVESLDNLMDKAWEIFIDETEGETLLYKKAAEISSKIIDRLINEGNQEAA
ncbi:hypothetical protein NIES22_50770 [Calothrix brevissima NIES-22]|nr:hypothetical protein NIES22_50770 [Calothrix brevissima NIES-22]